MLDFCHIRLILKIVGFFLLTSCSATRWIPEDENLLNKYDITVAPQSEITSATITPYIKQQPNNTILFGWKFLLSIYNLSPKSDSRWARLLKETGEAPVIFDPKELEKSKENIDRFVTSQGYYKNTLYDSISYKKRQATVHLNLTLGKQYPIAAIDYHISDSTMRSFLIADTIKSLLRFRPMLSEQLLERESERIAANLRKYGYYNFTKNHISFVADTFKRSNEATLTIQFKDRSREDEIAQMAAPQQRFTVEKIEVFTDWLPVQSMQNERFKSTFDSIEYKGIKIFHTGKNNLRPQVISRLNRIDIGDFYNERLVNTTYNRFSSLRLFSGVTLLFDAIPSIENQSPIDTNYVTPQQGALLCQIRLTQSKIQGYKINLEASSNSSGLIGLSPAFSYFHKNIFNGGERLTMSFSGNFQFKFRSPVTSTELGASTSLAFPTFLFPIPHKWFSNFTPQTDIGISYSLQQRPEYERNMLSLSFGYSWQNGERLLFRFSPVQLNMVRLYHVDSTFYKSLHDPFLINSYKDHFDLGSSFTLYYTTDNAPAPKNSYFYLRWTTDMSGNSLSMLSNSPNLFGTAYSQYWKNEINSVYTWKPDPDQSVAFRFYGGVGVAYGNSDAMPFEKLFYSGGANSLRAWQARSVGPGSMPIDTTFSIPNQTGDIKLETNIEYRPKLFWKLEGAFFVDAGNIWTLRHDLGREAGAFRKDFYKSIAIAGGVGLRLNLEFVLLRLDLGLVFRDPHLQKWIPMNNWFKANTYAIQFGVGYPFL
ncbi:MAG: outer membrane protein assembly factor [Prevotellaceae bacterium]|jgi:outer membrane protein assembly factor BamA|nr:outer membrane protein assembly factor [Prevotellaceae bacterium]